MMIYTNAIKVEKINLFIFFLLFKKKYCREAAKIINLIQLTDLDKANSNHEGSLALEKPQR